MCRKTSSTLKSSRLKSLAAFDKHPEGAVPLQSQSMVSNQQDHDPPSRPERHSSPQSPSTATHHKPPPRSWSNARTRCQRDTGSDTTTTISPHDTESATLDPPPRPRCAIHKPQCMVRPQRHWICG
ncbi:unnamed protein product [Pleuronectes platessa]|uniref:Uncharacterized protein n=1 Tax=Pleuronectes platessa TaxID=8262 RepID=A0A9N7UUW2_PLEPL|nr:unnamed protein product [Pleuronectes platessa]